MGAIQEATNLNVRSRMKKPGKTEQYTELMTITPAMARQWLSSNTSNRPISARIAASLAREIKEGKWLVNGDTIRFNTEGNLIDGQHRLRAVMDSNTSIQSWVAFNVPDEAYVTIDRNRRRTMADDLAVMGELNGRDLSTALTLLYGWEVGSINALRSKLRIANINAIMPILDANPGLRDSVSRFANGNTGPRISKVMSRGMAAFLHYLFSQKDRDLADHFFNQLETGHNLEGTEPVYILRERLREVKSKGMRLNNPAIITLAVKAWNATRENKPMQRLHIPQDVIWSFDAIPKIV